MTTDASISKTKRLLGSIFALIIVLAAVVVGWLYSRHEHRNPSSEEAVIGANVVHISAAVPGKISELLVQEGARVARGDVLFRLDNYAYQLRVQQARAEVAVAEAAVSANQRHTRAESSNADIANQQISRARQNLAMAQKTVQRLRPLAQQGYVAKQELDSAITLEQDAQVSLAQALAQASAAKDLVGDDQAALATLTIAQIALALAEKALDDTIVRAPVDGLVVGLKVTTGERLIPDQSLFTLIDTQNWYATAFYRETDLPALALGRCAEVYTLMAPKQVMRGTVDNIGWGVTDTEMINLPRSLPYVQKSLNWVRVAQRFPVRIQLDNPPAELMRVGASATVVVRPSDQCTNTSAHATH